MEAVVSPHNAAYCVWEDLDGQKWEFSYVVPLDGNEFLQYRAYRADIGAYAASVQLWLTFPSFAEPPKEVMEFFHGPLKQVEIPEPDESFGSLGIAGYPAANQIGRDAVEIAKNILVVKGEIIQGEHLLHDAPNSISAHDDNPSVAEALCTLMEAFNW
jgi:hypothetical protein